MTDRFKHAIRDTGGFARLSPDGTQSFAASVQPRGFEGDGHSPAGSGFVKAYTLFAEVNDASESLKQGDRIVFGDREYAVKSLSASYYRGEKAYISGIVLLCEEEVT